MNGKPTAAAAGKIDVGGDLTVTSTAGSPHSPAQFSRR